MEQPDSHSGRIMLESVSIAEDAPQFMMQRMHFDMNADLLPTPGALADYLPNYAPDDLLGHDLTEEDRNLAAALVAVQLVQQQKQQQQQITLEPPTAADPLVALDDAKVGLETASVLGISDKIAGNGLMGHQKVLVFPRHNDCLPPLKKNTIFTRSQLIDSFRSAKDSLKDQDDDKLFSDSESLSYDLKLDHPSQIDDSFSQRDSDCDKFDGKPSKKSLPHKKRISKKLKGRKVLKSSTTASEQSTEQRVCETVAPQLASFTCQLCLTVLPDQLSFFQHLKDHYEPVNNAKQNKPPKGDVDKVNEAKDTLLSSLLPSLSCTLCGKNVRRQKAEEAHINEAHFNKEVSDLSDFSEPEDLMAGIREVVDVQTRSADYPKSWYREDELHATEADLKEIEALELACQSCSSVFSTKEELAQHACSPKPAQVKVEEKCKEKAKAKATAAPDKSIAKVKKKKKKDFGCTQCNKVFRHRNSLTYHIKGHTGERAYQCEVCGKGFFAASALKVHMRLHSGAKPYKCDYCGRFFRQRGDLKYHISSLHSGERNYQCEYCGKDFARKYSLVLHRRIHTGENNYRCEFCGKTFRASSYLQNHRRIHTGEKPHACETCGKPFRVRSDMKRHALTHTRGRARTPGEVIGLELIDVSIMGSPDDPISILPDHINMDDMEEEEDKKESVAEAISVNETQFNSRDPLETVQNDSLFALPIITM